MHLKFFQRPSIGSIAVIIQLLLYMGPIYLSAVTAEQLIAWLHAVCCMLPSSRQQPSTMKHGCSMPRLGDIYIIPFPNSWLTVRAEAFTYSNILNLRHPT